MLRGWIALMTPCKLAIKSYQRSVYWLNYLHVRKPLILAHGAKLCLRNRSTHVYRSLAGIYFFIGGWMYIHIWVADVCWPPPPGAEKMWACVDRWTDCRQLARMGLFLFFAGGIHLATSLCNTSCDRYCVIHLVASIMWYILWPVLISLSHGLLYGR